MVMDLTVGNIKKNLVRFTIPIIIMQILNQAYSLIDSVIVAQFAGEVSLSVLASVNSCMTVGYLLVNGASAACHIIVGNLFGAKKYEEVKRAKHTMYLMMLIFSSLVAGCYILFSGQLLGLMQVPEEIMEESISVLWIYALNLPAIALSIVSQSVLNGSGNSKSPMIIGVGTQILNLILDYFAVAVWGYGVAGAAAASLFSVILVALLMELRAQRQMAQYYRGKAVLSRAYAKQMLVLGVPSIVQQSVMALGTLLLQALVNKQGIDSINGYTVACTINSFIMIPVLACCSGYETFAAQNFGAGNGKRVKEGFRVLLLYGMIGNLALAVLTVLLSKNLIALYLQNRESNAFVLAKQYLLLLIPNYFAQFGKNSIDAAFKARKKVYVVTASSILSLACRVALGWMLAGRFGLLVLACTTVAGNLVALLFHMWNLKRERKKEYSAVL